MKHQLAESSVSLAWGKKNIRSNNSAREKKEDAIVESRYLV